jgi:hypothetical protein
MALSFAGVTARSVPCWERIAGRAQTPHEPCCRSCSAKAAAPHGMHDKADHRRVDQSTDRQSAEEDHVAEAARRQSGDRRGEQ